MTISAPILLALRIAGAVVGRANSGNYQILVETGYTENGTPSQVVTRMLLGVGDMAYARETTRGHTVITQINKATGVTKIALEGGSEVLAEHDHSFTKRPSRDRSWPSPDKRKVQRINGVDCYRVRLENVDAWVRTSNTNDVMAIITHDQGRISESVVVLENRKSLDSDLRLFELPGKAHMRWVTTKELQAFQAKYVPDTTPDWVWARP